MLKTEAKYTGFAIALAWPETYCKQPGSWYDPLTLRLGLNKNHYYRVGHAAVVLIDTENRKSHYFDFGRYHAPFQYGRVRSAETDHELRIKTTPHISADNEEIVNFMEIISELQFNLACHGEGELHASYCPVNFQYAFAKANQMQKMSPIPYGPFRIKGSNCSRFVNRVILAGNPHKKYKFRLKYMVPLTPTPINNVSSLDHKLDLPDSMNDTVFHPMKNPYKKSLNSTLPIPPRNGKIPENAQWLSGEGAGSWFDFKVQNSHLKVTRYSPEGVIECIGLYETPDTHGLLPDHTFQITYPSNCKVVSLTKKDAELLFERVDF